MLFPSRRRVHLPVTDKHSRTLDVSARLPPARPLSGRLLFFVVYLGNVARRREREGRCTKAATDAELLQVPPPVRDYSCDGYSASCSLGCATRVPDPQPLGEILSHSLARSRSRHPCAMPTSRRGRKEKTFRFCRLHRVNKSSPRPLRRASTALLTRPDSFILALLSFPSANHPGSVPRG